MLPPCPFSTCATPGISRFTSRRGSLYYIEILTDISFPERAHVSLPGHSDLDHSNFKISIYFFFLASQGSHLKHAVFCKLKPGVFVVSTCQPRPNTSHALPGKAIQVGRRCPRLWRPRLWRSRLCTQISPTSEDTVGIYSHVSALSLQLPTTDDGEDIFPGSTPT